MFSNAIEHLCSRGQGGSSSLLVVSSGQAVRLVSVYIQ